MPKKKLATKKEPNNVIFLNKLKATYRKRPWLFIIVAGLLLWGIAWLSQVAVERYQFSKAESKIDEFSFQSVNEANKISDAKERYCVYSSAKFSKGTLRCSISKSAAYKAKSLDAANDIVYSLNKGFENNSSVDRQSVSSNNKSTFSSESVNDDSDLYSIRQSFRFNSLKNFKCSLIYRLMDEGGLKVRASIGCTKESKLEYFPVR